MTDRLRRCQGAGPLKPDGCSELALYLVTFEDGSSALCCKACALGLVEQGTEIAGESRAPTMERIA